MSNDDEQDVSMPDYETNTIKTEPLPSQVKTNTKKKKKGNLNFNGVDDLNIYLPNNYEELKNLIKDDFSLIECSIDINDYYICYHNQNKESEIKNQDNYLKALKYFDNIDLKDRIIFIKPKKSTEEKKEKKKKEEEKEEEEEEEKEEVPNFIDLIDNIVEKEFTEFGKCLKASLINGDVNDRLNIFRANNNVHYEECIECGLELITGFLYKCAVEEDVYLCNKCVATHEHPTFKIP